MTATGMSLAVRVACYLSLISLALMAWSLIHPMPIPIILAMSLGQVIGTLGFALFLIVVVSDLRKRLRSRPSAPPSAPTSKS